jgi:hypothetical protein
MSLEKLLAERFPWATQQQVQRAAQLLEARLDTIDDDGPFTMEMLEEAEQFGHELAQIIGPPPNMGQGEPL